MRDGKIAAQSFAAQMSPKSIESRRGHDAPVTAFDAEVIGRTTAGA